MYLEKTKRYPIETCSTEEYSTKPSKHFRCLNIFFLNKNFIETAI